MKRIRNIILCCILAAILCFSMIGCDNSSNKGQDTYYTVTFQLGNGESDSTASVKEGETVSAPSDPERENYTFSGWYSDSACTNQYDFETAIYSDITIYAGWTEVVNGIYVSFMWNYDGSPDDGVYATAEVEDNVVTAPVDPERESYLFSGWYSDADCTEEFDFETEIDSDLSVYAKWIEDDGNNICITFLWNYEDSPNNGVYTKKYIETGTKTSSVSVTRSGYYFYGWYTDEECTSRFSFSKVISEDVTLYAKWLYGYTFEAEYVDFTGKTGHGFSDEVYETDMIVKDNFGAEASNGYYVSSLYDKGQYLEFNIVSDRDIDDAVIYLRLSVEYNDMTLSDTDWVVELNGESVAHDTLYLTGALEDMTLKRAFSDYYIAKNLSLKEGDNVIRLITNNNIKGRGGTMSASAPMVDCMYIYTDATLSWEPLLSNI